MNFIKRNKYLFLGILAVLVIGLFFVNNQALASSLLEQVGEQSGVPKAELTTVIANLIKTVLGFVGILLILIILYAGFLWMTAGGVPDNVTKAKAWLTNAIIGLVIIALSYSIASFVTKKLNEGISGTSSSGVSNIDYQLLNILK
jgi:uncharacterized membrane protein YbhN (UPF0104 family)